MTDADKNRRIYECLREIYILTHNRDEYEVLGGTPQNLEEDFDPMEIHTLADFQASPNLFRGRGPEEVVLP